MRKILISALIVSGVAMSGDIAKCTHAMDMMEKYSSKSSEQRSKAKEKESEKPFVVPPEMLKELDAFMQKIMKDSVSKKSTKMIAELYKKQGRAFESISIEWAKQGAIECKGILDEEIHQYFFVDNINKMTL